MGLFQPIAAAVLLGSVVGCHSASIDAVVENRTEQPISLVEIDYPTASFGTQTLMPKEDFHYRFKALGDGPTKVLWTDLAHVEHTAAGPELREGDEGKLTVTFGPGGPAWVMGLKNHGQAR